MVFVLYSFQTCTPDLLWKLQEQGIGAPTHVQLSVYCGFVRLSAQGQLSYFPQVEAWPKGLCCLLASRNGA